MLSHSLPRNGDFAYKEVIGDEQLLPKKLFIENVFKSLCFQVVFSG